ncbi:MAG: IPT/TIG domain-containing protein, partial [Bradymonadaceae bacterium]
MPAVIRRQAGRIVLVVTVAFLGVAAVGCSDTEVDDPGDTGPAQDTSVADADAGGLDAADTAPPEEETDTGGTEDDADTGPARDIPGWDTSLADTDESDGGLAPLSLKRVSPARGPVAGGTQFVVTGEGFTRETTLFFGSRQAETELVDGKLVGQTPKAAGTGPVAVKALDPQTGEDVLPKAFTYTESLRVDTVTPDRIPTDGGVEVTIEGNGFDTDTRVSFDGNTGLTHEFVDGDTLRVVAPANEAGPATLRVTTSEETTAVEGAVTYFTPLAVDSVDPATGPTSGGTSVTLVGQGFTSGMTVSFGTKSATVQSVTSGGTEATVVTPSNTAGLVDVGVQTESGDAVLVEDAFYYRKNLSEFRLAAVDPGVGPTSGNREVRLIGAGLYTNGLSVEFGGTAAPVKRTGAGWAVVDLPGHSAGVVDVTVIDGQGNSSILADGFEYVRDLSVDSASPGEGPAAGGTSVVIQGTGFQNTEKVLFGGV